MPKSPVLIEGLTPDGVLALPEDEMAGFVLCGEPISFHAGSAEILGQFKVDGTTLRLELVHIDGGGEGVLPTIAAIASRYAKMKYLTHLEWCVHATKCVRPNERLRKLLVRRGFTVRDVPGTGECYHLIQETKLVSRPGDTFGPVARVYEAPAHEVPDHSESMRYYPNHSDILPNGNLRMATNGIGRDGERWSGSREVSPDHPLYLEWRALIEG